MEVIVVDDGSTDETAAILKTIHDERLNWIRLETNSGAAAARNAGIQISRGSFLAFQDSDDEWLPGNLDRHMSVFENSSRELGVVYSDMYRISSKATVSLHKSPSIPRGALINPVTRFYQAFRLGIQSVVLRRECLNDVGLFDEKLTALEDLELFIRLSKRYDFYHIEEPLVRYYESEGLSKNLYSNWLARKRLLKLYWRELLLRNILFWMKECRWLYRNRKKALQQKHSGQR
jgi:glycosyltransferase involved in cell wall biosynthesis